MVRANEVKNCPIVVAGPRFPSYVFARDPEIDFPRSGNHGTPRTCHSVVSCSASGACVRPRSHWTGTPRHRCCTCDVRRARWMRVGSSYETLARFASDKPHRNNRTSGYSRWIDSYWTVWEECEPISCVPAARPRSRIHRVRRARIAAQKCHSLYVCCCRVDLKNCYYSTLVSDLSSKISFPRDF